MIPPTIHSVPLYHITCKSYQRSLVSWYPGLSPCAIQDRTDQGLCESHETSQANSQSASTSQGRLHLCRSQEPRQTTTAYSLPLQETLDAHTQFPSEDVGGSHHRVNQYTIMEEIGRGSYGAVHLAKDQFGQEFVSPP